MHYIGFCWVWGDSVGSWIQAKPPDATERFGLAVVSLIGSDKLRVGQAQGYSVVKGVEQVMAKLDGQVTSALVHAGGVVNPKFQLQKVRQIVVRLLRLQTRKHCRDFGRKMRWLMEADLPVSACPEDRQRLVGIGFVRSALKKPFRRDAGVNHQSIHGRPCSRAS